MNNKDVLVSAELAKEKLIHEIDILGNVYAVAKITIMNLIRNTDLTDCQQTAVAAGVTVADVEEFRKENYIFMDDMPDWAIKENRVLNAVCDIASGWIRPAPDQGSVRNATDRGMTMSDDQIMHMVDRFLGWRLPEKFSPDAGISFKAGNHPDALTHLWPTGTNLFDATQAEAMIRYLVDGMPIRALPDQKDD